MEKLKRFKPFISDMFLNIVGFGIYIIAQQILLLPILAKLVNDDIYSSIVLYISILNVVCNITGGELGNVRIIRDSEYKEKNIMGDFFRILLSVSPMIAIILLPVFILYLNYSIVGSILLVLTILMANIRLYSTCYYRLQQQYSKVIWQNVCYLIGIIVSLILFKLFENIYLLLFIPELICTIYALKNSDIFQMKLEKTTEMLNTVKKFFQLGVVSTLTNLMTYFDKFMIYPMFGATSVAVYYAVNSMSKIVSLILTPISSVILSWVSGKQGGQFKNKIIKFTLLINIPLLILITFVAMPLTYISLKILYSQYMADALKLIIPISITTAFGTVITLVKSILLKFSKTNKLVVMYIIYFIVFIILAFILSKSGGIEGFAVANLIAKVILWLEFIILLFISKNEKVERIEENENN